MWERCVILSVSLPSRTIFKINKKNVGSTKPRMKVSLKSEGYLGSVNF